MQPADIVALVLLLAAAIGCVNHLLIRLPRSIGMLLGALAVSLAAVAADRLFGLPAIAWFRDAMDGADLPHVFLDGTLALLLFAGSLHVDARELSRAKWLILVLATFSVVIATLVFGLGLFAAFRLSGVDVRLGWCMVVGAILAPTDAVVVDSLLRRAPLPTRLRAAITGESLFNDGAALVLYVTVLAIMAGQTGLIGHGHFLEALVVAVAGGAAIGVACGAACSLLVRRLRDEGLHLLVTLALVIGCYRLADAADVSGPIAVVAAGVALKLMTPDFAPGTGRYAALIGFWGLLDELMDTMLFLLIGLQLLSLTFAGLLLPMLVAPLLALLARVLSIALPVALSPGRLSERLRDLGVLTWTGLRGGISVALALTMPASPHRGQLLGVCYAVVLFTIVVQGLTVPRVLATLCGRAPGVSPRLTSPHG